MAFAKNAIPSNLISATKTLWTLKSDCNNPNYYCFYYSATHVTSQILQPKSVIKQYWGSSHLSVSKTMCWISLPNRTVHTSTTTPATTKTWRQRQRRRCTERPSLSTLIQGRSPHRGQAILPDTEPVLAGNRSETSCWSISTTSSSFKRVRRSSTTAECRACPPATRATSNDGEEIILALLQQPVWPDVGTKKLPNLPQ